VQTSGTAGSERRGAIEAVGGDDNLHGRATRGAADGDFGGGFRGDADVHCKDCAAAVLSEQRAGGSHNFTVTATDPSGAANITNIELIYNWQPSGVDGCLLNYDVVNDALSMGDLTGSMSTFGSMSLLNPSGALETLNPPLHEPPGKPTRKPHSNRPTMGEQSTHDGGAIDRPWGSNYRAIHPRHPSLMIAGSVFIRLQCWSLTPSRAAYAFAGAHAPTTGGRRREYQATGTNRGIHK
jgi:hypothetical protein